MKCGTEFLDGRRHASAVFTRDFSAWYTMPDLSDTAEIWWRTVRKKDSVETLCSLDGQKFTSARQGILYQEQKCTWESCAPHQRRPDSRLPSAI
jgi:regulation of enolase protein 1 (concanavalin A-like superfamily)